MSDSIQPNNTYMRSGKRCSVADNESFTASDMSDSPKGWFMKHVSLHVTKSDYDKPEYIKCQKSRSEYLIMLINTSFEKVKAEEEALNKTYKMMSHMKYVLSQIDKQAQGDI